MRKQNFITKLIRNAPRRLAPGQTRPLAFQLWLQPSGLHTLQLIIRYQKGDASSFLHSDVVSFDLESRGIHEAHKFTFLHPSKTVSYAIVRPPSKAAVLRASSREAWPVMLALHGAGVEADSDEGRGAFSTASDLRCWLVCPTGMTPWSGDDWRKSFAVQWH